MSEPPFARALFYVVHIFPLQQPHIVVLLPLHLLMAKWRHKGEKWQAMKQLRLGFHGFIKALLSFPVVLFASGYTTDLHGVVYFRANSFRRGDVQSIHSFSLTNIHGTSNMCPSPPKRKTCFLEYIYVRICRSYLQDSGPQPGSPGTFVIVWR